MSSKNDVLYQVVARPPGRNGRLALLALLTVFFRLRIGSNCWSMECECCHLEVD